MSRYVKALFKMSVQPVVSHRGNCLADVSAFS